MATRDKLLWADGKMLAESEVFALLNDFVRERSAGRERAAVELTGTPHGPSSRVPVLLKEVTTTGSQFTRTAADVADLLRKQRRIPSTVWLGSVAVPPE